MPYNPNELPYSSGPTGWMMNVPNGAYRSDRWNEIAGLTNKAQGAAGAGQMAASLYGLYQGIRDGRLAKKMEKDLVRPLFEIPEAAQESYNLSKNLAAPKTTALDDLALQKNQNSSAIATSRAISGSTSSQDLLAAVTGINATETDGNTAILDRALNDYNRRQEVLRQEAGRMAEWQNKAQEFNKIDPFYEKAAAISALKNSKEQNIQKGIGGLVQGGTSVAQSILTAGMM